MLEVLTGRRALERDRTSGDRYLKDLVDEVEDCGSSAAAWRKQLDHRLTSGGAVEHSGCMQLVTLACRCLERKRKKRPAMTKESSCPPINLPPPLPQECSVEALSNQLSRLGPLEDSYLLTLLTHCHPLPPSLSSSLPPPLPPSLVHVRRMRVEGFSQYDLQSPAGSLKSGSLKSASPQPPDLYGVTEK
ncbi:hypothetical protein F7725_001474 [Dissostichus mawsoni]|uniref:Uncharacterized protein n=1 Tax=Dissostichus mawsoni TaxID=36200 RepID=A0A7J5ZJU2_DISMA|nr:hypothetical protein F7725_001474 [Dissostichus mawsoni]